MNRELFVSQLPSPIQCAVILFSFNMYRMAQESTLLLHVFFSCMTLQSSKTSKSSWRFWYLGQLKQIKKKTMVEKKKGRGGVIDLLNCVSIRLQIAFLAVYKIKISASFAS